MHDRRMPFLALALACVIALLLAACGSSDSSSTSSGGSETSAGEETSASGEGGSSLVSEAEAAVKEFTTVPTKTVDTLPAYTPKPSQSLFLVTCNLELPGCSRFANAVKAASKAIGYSIKVCNSGATPETQAACFTQAVNAKPDGVIVQGVGRAEADDGYTELEKAKIPIVANVSGNEPGESPGVYTEVNGESCIKDGQLLGEWIIADSGGKGNVVMYYTDIYKCVKQRAEELEKTLAKCSECSLELKQFAINQLQTGLPQEMQADLQSNPDTEYIVGGFDAIALLATNAVRETGKTESISVLGTDGDEPNLALIQKDEIMKADALTGFGEDGWLATDMIARVIAGEKTPPNLNGNVFVIEPENVEEALEGGTAWEGPVGYESQIEALWK